MPRYDRLLSLLGILFFAAVSTSCRHATSEAPASSAPEVTVSQPIEREITDPLDFTGRMEAVDSVEIRARVSGHLSEIYFKPGADVKKGDPAVSHRSAAVRERAEESPKPGDRGRSPHRAVDYRTGPGRQADGIQCHGPRRL